MLKPNLRSYAEYTSHRPQAQSILNGVVPTLDPVLAIVLEADQPMDTLL